MDEKSEKHLIMRAAKDPAAFGELFEEYFDSILRYCIYHTAHVETARDITAETFYKAFKNINRFRFTAAPFSAWLYRIARNEIVDSFRSKKYRHKKLSEAMKREEFFGFESRSYLVDETEALQQKLEKNRAYQQIRHAMEKLPIHYRDVLVLRYVEEKKISEISTILCKKEGTVKSLISRGISALRELSLEKVQQKYDSTVSINKIIPKESL